MHNEPNSSLPSAPRAAVIPPPAVSRPGRSTAPAEAGERPVFRPFVAPRDAAARDEQGQRDGPAAERLASAPGGEPAATDPDATWLTLLDSTADAELPDQGGAAEPVQDTSSAVGVAGSVVAEQVAAQLERIAQRLRRQSALEDWVAAGDGDPLELLLAGVVLGYVRGRAAAPEPPSP